MKRSEIDILTTLLLKKWEMIKIPIKADQIPKRLDIKLEKSFLGNEIFSLLVIEKGKYRLGYNNSESDINQRFSIAYQLGNYHINTGEHPKDSLFIQINSGLFRKHELSQKEARKEYLANYFAMCLLIPSETLEARLESALKYKPRLSNDEIIKSLAKQYQVSESLMTLRLSDLNILI